MGKPSITHYHIRQTIIICKLSDAKQITNGLFFRYDYVKIYDGDKTSTDLLAELTGNAIETSIFTSTGLIITVELQSDGSSLEGFKGFNLEYRAGMCNVEELYAELFFREKVSNGLDNIFYSI